MARFAAILFLTVGFSFLLLGLFLVWERNNPNRLAFYNTQDLISYTATGSAQMPIRFSIPDQHIALPIIPALIKGNTWQDTKLGVSYLSSSPRPGDIGNGILYGHNWNSLLGRLTNVVPGEKILVTYPSSLKIFTVRYTATVSPSEISILKPTDDRRITVYTCTGFLDSRRFVVVATLASDPDTKTK